MPPELKEKQQIDRMEQSLSGVSARFDELTARFESSINSLNDVMRTHSADLAAHNDQYGSRFSQIERAFESIESTLNQQSVRLTALEQTAGWVSSVMASVVQGSSPAQGGSNAGGRTGGSHAGSGGGSATGSGATATLGRSAATSSTDTGSTTGTSGTSGTSDSTGTGTTDALKYPDVSNASSYVGAGLQAGGAMIASPDLARGWTQALAFAPAAVGLVDDMAANLDSKKTLQRAAASALAGGALLLVAKAMR